MDIKKTFLLIAATMISAFTMAQTITPVFDKDAKTVSILVNTDFECWGVGLKFDLPEGVTVPKYENDDEDLVPNIVKGSRAKSSATLDVKTTTTGYSLNLYGAALKSDATKPAIVITLDGNLTGKIKFWAIAFTDQPGKSYEQNDFEFDMTTAGISDVTADAAPSSIYTVSGIKATKMQKGQLYIKDGKKVINK